MTREQYNSASRGQALLIRTWVQHNQRPLTDIRDRNFRERLVRMKTKVPCCEGSLLSPALLRIVVHSSLSIQGPARERRNTFGGPRVRWEHSLVLSLIGWIAWDRGLG
ncbi:hypothetical protein C8J56DRAFT_1030736 [Mycena floridula]|nr:hypothetical protein C8J56DRAFT_1030736 [Mycena floridula]